MRLLEMQLFFLNRNLTETNPGARNGTPGRPTRPPARPRNRRPTPSRDHAAPGPTIRTTATNHALCAFFQRFGYVPTLTRTQGKRNQGIPQPWSYKCQDPVQEIGAKILTSTPA